MTTRTRDEDPHHSPPPITLKDMEQMVLDAFNDFNLSFEPEEMRATCGFELNDLQMVMAQAPILHLRIQDECDAELIAIFEWPWSQGDYPKKGVTHYEPARLRQLTIIADTYLTTLLYDDKLNGDIHQGDNVPSAARSVKG